MNIEKYKSDYLDKRMQLILFYKDSGEILYSTETLFNVLPEKSIYQINPFIESISMVLQDLQSGTPLTFSCINNEVDGQSVFYDYQFEVPEEDERDIIVMQVFNFSDHYENLTNMQQERNELEIHKEVFKLEQEKVFAQNELLAYKNSELERIQHLKTDFFARVSHEIRNPVNGISGLIQLISTNFGDQEKITEYLEALNATSDHLVNMVNNVLDFSKLESHKDKHELEYLEFDCKKVVRSIINSFLFSAKEKKISLDAKVAKNVPQILLGDKYKLTQVITNLVGNALKFTHEGGIMLTVSATKFEGKISTIRFELRDTGIGIAESMIENIFNPYVQADQSVKRLYGGTGLGLPIVKSLVEAMKGTIEVSSEEGEGSIFTFHIPFEVISEESSTNTSPELFFDGSVLLGEDDLINQKVMEGMLESEGILCDIAKDGQEVLDFFQQRKYGLFILDVNMPVMDGLDVANKIRQKVDTPIIIYSGKPYAELEHKLKGLKGIEYIQKPISRTSLINAFNKISKPTNKLVDFKLFRKLFGNNQKRLAEIIAIFIEEAPENVKNMKDHFFNRDYEELKTLVHKAKSSFAYFGMQRTHDLCDQIESDIDNNIKRNYLLSIEKIEEDTVSAIKELKQA